MAVKQENKLYHYKAHVRNVVDGDTVDVTLDLGFGVHLKERVRLFGINTPETRTRDKEEKKRGLAAKAFVKEALKLNGNECLIKTRLKGAKGKFGRVLGTVYVDGLNLNAALVHKGHAERYYGGKRK